MTLNLGNRRVDIFSENKEFVILECLPLVRTWICPTWPYISDFFYHHSKATEIVLHSRSSHLKESSDSPPMYARASPQLDEIISEAAFILS